MKKTLLLAIFMSSFFAYAIMAQTSCDTIWTKSFGGPGTQAFRFVRQISDDGYILTGISGIEDTDFYAIRTNSIGDTLWTRTYGGDQGEEADCIQETSDGGFIICGATNSFGAGGTDAYLVRTDENGDTLWTHTYGGESTDWGFSVQQTPDDGFIMAGWSDSFGVSTDVYVVRTNALGDTLWTRTYGGNMTDVAYSIELTSDGGFVIAGILELNKSGYVVFDMYLIKINDEGDVLWTRNYGGNHNEIANFVQETTDGGFILAGMTGEGPGSHNFYLVKTDANGDTLWTRAWGGLEDDMAYSVKQTNDGGYIVTGNSESFGPLATNIYIVRTDQDGNTLWTQTYGKGEISAAYSLDVCSDGTYVIAGLFGDASYNFDGWLLLIHDVITATEENNSFLSKPYSLFQNFPNPFNSSTTISFSVKDTDKNTNITIYNFNGQKIKTLVDMKLNADTHQIVWDCTDDSNNPVSSGMYFYRMEYGDKYTDFKKMLLMK